MKAIIDALETKLAADQSAGTFYAAMGGRFYLEQAPENETFPYMVYSMIDGAHGYAYGAVVQSSPRFQFDIYALKTDASWATYEQKLYDLLNGNTLSPSGYDRGNVFFTNRQVVTIEEDAVRIMDEAIITATDH